MIIGYTTGVFDLFHIGHLNIIRESKKKCDYLIVAVSNDQLAFKLKKRKPVIPFKERLTIIESLKYVNLFYKFDIIFKGDDWKKTKKWKKLKKSLNKLNTKVVFLKYTKGTSSTLIKNVCKKIDKRK